MFSQPIPESPHDLNARVRELQDELQILYAENRRLLEQNQILQKALTQNHSYDRDTKETLRISVTPRSSCAECNPGTPKTPSTPSSNSAKTIKSGVWIMKMTSANPMSPLSKHALSTSPKQTVSPLCKHAASPLSQHAASPLSKHPVSSLPKETES